MSRDMACRLCIPSVPYICAFHQCPPSACAYFRGCGTHRPTLSREKGGAVRHMCPLPAPAACAFHVHVLGLRNPGVPKGREIRAPICDPSSSWHQYANQSHAPAGCGVNLKEAGADKKGLHTARNASLWWQRRPTFCAALARIVSGHCRRHSPQCAAPRGTCVAMLPLSRRGVDPQLHLLGVLDRVPHVTYVIAIDPGD